MGGALLPDGEARILALTLWGECRGEPYLGQVGVACVIRNRVLDSRWPDTYEEVCKQPQQFSCWNGEARISPDERALLWKRLLHIAEGVVEDKIPDVTKGANHYLNSYAAPPDPEWGRTYHKITLWPSEITGVHTFYRL